MSTRRLGWDGEHRHASSRLAGASPVAAQLPTYGVGRPPTAEEVRAWDLTIPAGWPGLAAGQRDGRARQGDLRGAVRLVPRRDGRGPEIQPRGPRRRPRLDFDHAPSPPVLTIGSFWQYATTLWSYIRRAQPFDEPGSLTADQVYAVTAYLLHVNGIIGEQDVIDARTLPQIKMPNRDGFVPDARPDVGKAAKARTRSPERAR